jgi:hypothetical protein
LDSKREQAYFVTGIIDVVLFTSTLVTVLTFIALGSEGGSLGNNPKFAAESYEISLPS